MNTELALLLVVGFMGFRGLLQVIAGAARIEKSKATHYGFGDVMAGLFFIALFVWVMFV